MNERSEDIAVKRQVRHERPVVDFHQLDECEHCGAMMDHWKTANEDGTFWATWECPKCGYYDGQTENAEGQKL